MFPLMLLAEQGLFIKNTKSSIYLLFQVYTQIGIHKTCNLGTQFSISIWWLSIYLQLSIYQTKTNFGIHKLRIYLMIKTRLTFVFIKLAYTQKVSYKS